MKEKFRTFQNEKSSKLMPFMHKMLSFQNFSYKQRKFCEFQFFFTEKKFRSHL